MSAFVYDPNRPLNNENLEKKLLSDYSHLRKKCLNLNDLVELQSGDKLLIVNNFNGSSDVVKIASFERSEYKNILDPSSYTFYFSGVPELYGDIYLKRWFAFRAF